MRLVFCLVCALMLVVPAVMAEVIITEVMYDPVTSESDTEYVELYNTGDSDVDIGGWSLNTSTQQAVLPAATKILSKSYFLISDIDNSGAWPADWPTADYTDEITLPNTNSGLKLISAAHEVVDAVGWGNSASGLYLGTPHPQVKEGESLARKQENSAFANTLNNSEDFFASLPTPMGARSSAREEGSQEIIIHAAVQGNAPAAGDITISPDDLPDPGIQVIPVPGALKQVTVQVMVDDQDGLSDIRQVLVQSASSTNNLTLKSAVNTTSGIYAGNIALQFYEPAGNRTVTVVAVDRSGMNSTASAVFRYLELVAFDVDTKDISFSAYSGQASDTIGDQDMATKGAPTIRNTGNTRLDFKVGGSDLFSGPDAISSDSLLYTFLDDDFGSALAGPVTHTSVLNDVNLAPGPSSLREFSLRLSVPPGSGAGSYQGSIFLTGVAS